MKATLTVNGRAVEIDVPPHHTLLDVLRDRLQLTGTKECCAEGECGACTVLMDGRAVDSCLVLAVEAEGHQVQTVEGAETDPRARAVQNALLEHGAVQCGFCIPGIVMAAASLLQMNPSPTVAQIQEGLAGNLCRCAAYSRIITAVAAAAKTL